MREFIETHYGATVLRWAEPTEDGELYEVVYRGRMIRADSGALVLSALQEAEPMLAVSPLRWTNVVAWHLPQMRAA